MKWTEAYQQIREHHYRILDERESISKSARLSLSTWVLDILTECRVADTPQTEVCGDCIWHVCNYNKAFAEPQADGILFKGDLKEGDYKLIKTTDGWVLANEDIVYCGWERGNE